LILESMIYSNPASRWSNITWPLAAVSWTSCNVVIGHCVIRYQPSAL